MEDTNSTKPDWVHLTPTEELRWSGRQSAYTLIGTILTTLILIAAGIIGTAYLSTIELGEDVPAMAEYAPLILSAFAILFFTIAYLRWRFSVYAVTSEELYHRYGIINKTTNQMRISRIQNSTCSQSIIERLFSFGDITIYTAGTDEFDFVFRNIPNPQEVNREITLLIDASVKGNGGANTGTGAEGGT